VDLVDELGAAGFEHFGDAVEDLAAVAGGGRRPLRQARPGGQDGVAGIFAEACAALARKSPWAEVTAYDLPDSLRGNAPPMNSYVLSRAAISASWVDQRR
jgi:hypothetical protein